MPDLSVSDHGAGLLTEARPALGAGDDDPRSPAIATYSEESWDPLMPGDNDPRSPARIVGPDTSRRPLAPGESDGENLDEAFEFLAPPPAGPGAQAVARSLVKFPKIGAV